MTKHPTNKHQRKQIELKKKAKEIQAAERASRVWKKRVKEELVERETLHELQPYT